MLRQLYLLEEKFTVVGDLSCLELVANIKVLPLSEIEIQPSEGNNMLWFIHFGNAPCNSLRHVPS